MPVSKNLKLEGQQFHYWTVLRLAKKRHPYKTRWICKCKCGAIKEIAQYDLVTGHSKSCRCYSTELLMDRFRRGLNRPPSYGEISGTGTYRTWRTIMNRCYCKSSKSYKNYGGRGIKVCKRWLDFRNFYADMGERLKGMSIDRIDSDGNYKLKNCRWADMKQQSRNKRNTVRLRYLGETRPLVEWCEILGLPYARIASRISTGWSVKDALTMPKINKHHPISIKLRSSPR